MKDSTFCSNPVSNNLEQGLPNGIVTLLGNILAEHIDLVYIELRKLDFFFLFLEMSNRQGNIDHTFRLAFIRRKIRAIFQSNALRTALLVELNNRPPDSELIVKMIERVQVTRTAVVQPVQPIPQPAQAASAQPAPAQPAQVQPAPAAMRLGMVTLRRVP